MRSPYPAYGDRLPADASHSRYPPAKGPYGNLPSSSALDLSSPHKLPLASHPPRGLRTPSPTPSEAEELARTSPLDWNKLKSPRFWFRKEWVWYYVAIVLISVLVALITIYHSQLVHWLTPAANWMKNLPAGWTIPIAILFVISFPPLFGHEIIAVLCGVVWGLWIGFAIVAAGTFLGEVGNFYAFKWCCRARGEKLEQTNITYGVLARVVRDGGFKIALIARLSAIPGHFTTAVFSSCGMGILVFALAAVLSLPKQFVTVYLGVLIEGADVETTGQRIASYAVVAVTFAITVLAMWYIYRQMALAKPAYIYDRRKARQAKLSEANSMSTSSFSQSSVTLHAAEPSPASSSEVALHAYSPTDPSYQQWDASGHAVGYAADPRLHQPSPRAAPGGRSPTFGHSSTDARYDPEYDGAGGVSYPTSPRADGRVPVRQNSWENNDERFAAPAASPALRNPYDAASAPDAYPSTAPPRTRIAQAQSRPQSPQQQPLAASVSPYDAVYEYNPYPAHPYATAGPAQAQWPVPAPAPAPGAPDVALGHPPTSAPAGSGTTTPQRLFSPPPPSYRA